MYIRKVATLVTVLALIAGCGFGPSHPAASHQSPKKPSPGATTKGWIPALADVRQLTLTLGGNPPLAFYVAGPLQIYPTSQKGDALIEKLLHLLSKGKATPLAPEATGGPVDAHGLIFYLKDGRTLYFSQSYGQTHEASLSVVDAILETQGPPSPRFKSVQYEDPALAQWLAEGWYRDTQAISSGWTCASKEPPMGHPNQITGTLPSGQAWTFVASSQAGCVTFYARKNGTWTSSLVTDYAPSGATVQQAQFVDDAHGFVLVGGSPGAGQLPRVLYETSDGGDTWSALPNIRPFPMSDTDVQMRFTSPTDGWLTTLNGFYSPERVYVYHSTNGGQSWTDTYFTLPPAVQQDGSDYTVALLYYFTPGKPNGTIVVFGPWTGDVWFITSDGGLHWQYDPLGNG